MADTADDLLSRIRIEAAAWMAAPVLSGERESAGGRLASAVLKLDELLSNGAQLPSGWMRGGEGSGTLMFGTGWFLCDILRERRARRGREAAETARWERDKERRP